MKYFKNIFFLITAILGTHTSIHAIPTFELFNKSRGNIVVSVECGSIKFRSFPIRPQGKLTEEDTIDSTKTITLTIDDNDLKKQFKFSINQRPNRQVTTYLTWNPAKKPSLYPQTGPLIGLAGKTESGLSLKNNVKSSDISQKQ